MFCQHTWIKEGARWRDVCIPKQLEGTRRQMLRFYVYVFAQPVWRYGGLGRTKGQGQISWLCRGNSWGKQTRKSLHFIKGSAGSHSHPPPSITPLLPPVCHQAGWLVSSAGNMSRPNKSIMNQTNKKRASDLLLSLIYVSFIMIANWFNLRNKQCFQESFQKSDFWPLWSDFWVPAMSAVTFIFSISCSVRVSCHSRPANLLHSGSLQLCSQNNWLLFLLLKKGGLSLWAMLKFIPTSRGSSPVYLHYWRMDDLSSTCMKE